MSSLFIQGPMKIMVLKLSFTIYTTIKKWVLVAWCNNSWLVWAPLSFEGPSQSERMVGDDQHNGTKETWKISSSKSPARQTQKDKMQGTFNGCLGLPHWLHEISPPKKIYHYFWLDLHPLTSPTFFYWIWLAPTKKNWNYEGSQKLKIIWTDGVPPPLAHQYMWKREDFEQNIWD